jgi:hypothetical protein
MQSFSKVKPIQRTKQSKQGSGWVGFSKLRSLKLVDDDQISQLLNCEHWHCERLYFEIVIAY